MSALIETVSSSRALGARIEEITQTLSHTVELCDLKSRRLFEAGFRKGAQALAAVDASLRGEVLIPLTTAHKTNQASIRLFSTADVPNLDDAAIALRTGTRQLTQLHTITKRTTRELLRQLDAITQLGNQMLSIGQVIRTAHQTLTAATKHAETAIRSAKMAQRALDESLSSLDWVGIPISAASIGHEFFALYLPNVARDPRKLEQHNRYVKKYAKDHFVVLEDGRIRYRKKLRPADIPGEMKGSRTVKEFDPERGVNRSWQETLDHHGRVRQVRPHSNGPKVHYTFDTDGNYTGKWSSSS